MQGKRKVKQEDDSTLRRSSRQKTQEKEQLDSDVEIIEKKSSVECKFVYLFLISRY